MKIYLSPSVQSFNIGYGNYGSEKFRMQQLADYVEQKLIDLGKFEVLRSSEDMTLNQAIADSNKNNVDLHVALHSNAADGNAQGPSVYAFRPGIKADKAAQAVYNELLDIYYDKSKGKDVNYNENLKEVRLTRSPAMIVEVAFHDNPQDAEWIVNNMDIIADAIVRGIVNYFGRMAGDVTSEVKDIINNIEEIKEEIQEITTGEDRGSDKEYISYLDL